MKTKKIYNQRSLKGILTVIAIALFSFSANAQQSLKSFEMRQYTSSLFNSSTEIMTAMNAAKEKKAFYEKEIHLEEWMMDLENWIENVDSSVMNSGELEMAPASELEEGEIMETELEMESWMFSANWIEKDIFVEEELVLEEWMKHPKMWNIYACN
jgi:hypothetical protein